jgi:ankyrin repeat protein
MEGVDEKGHTPLHVAVECNASPQAIDCLLYWYPEASSLKDCRGKTPLHLLFCSPNSENAQCAGLAEESQQAQPGQTKTLRLDPKQSNTAHTIQIIQSLIRAAPQSVNEEDDFGLNPLEYAINCGSSMSVIRTLQRASVVAWNEMDRNKANQEVLKKRLQAAVTQTEQASRRRFISITPRTTNGETVPSTITNTNKTIAAVSRSQMLIDQLLSKSASTISSHYSKRTKHDRRKNWIENGLMSEDSFGKRLTCSREPLKSSASKAA